MCLKVEGKARFKKSKKEITCYKVLRNHGDNIYSAPYHMMLVSLGKEYRTGAEKMDYKEKNGVTLIKGDAFHSFKKKEDAVALAAELAKSLRDDDKFTYAVAECVIPEGNNIIMGLFKEYEGICSDAIKYVKIV